MCPVHGTVGNLCKLYLASSNLNAIDESPSLYPSMVPEPTTYIINGNSVESWIQSHEFYNIKVDVINPVRLDMTRATYVSIKTNCSIQGISYICTRYFSHPLYNYCMGYESGIGIVTDSITELGPFQISRIKVLHGMKTNVQDRDLPTVDCEFKEIYVDEDCASICYRNNYSRSYSIIVLSTSYSNLIQTLQYTYKQVSDMYTILDTGAFKRNWLLHTHSISNISDKTVVYIPKDIMLGTKDGDFTSSPCTPSIIYINGQLCIVMYSKRRECVLFDKFQILRCNSLGLSNHM